MADVKAFRHSGRFLEVRVKVQADHRHKHVIDLTIFGVYVPCRTNHPGLAGPWTGWVFENLCLTLLLVDCTLTCEWLAAPTDEGDASDHSEKTKNAKR